MADYHPLVARAVAGLDNNTSEARRSLYERARAALVEQLRGATPTLSESDITRERLALEEAIRRVEAEEARRGRLERPPPASSPPARTDEMSSPSPAEDAAEQTEDRAALPSGPAPLTVETAATPEAMAPPAAPPEPQSPDWPDQRYSLSDDQRSDGDRPLSPHSPSPEPQSEQPPHDGVMDHADSARLNEALRKLRGRFTSGKEGDVVPPWPRVPPPEYPSADRPEPAPTDSDAAVPADTAHAADIGAPYLDHPLRERPRRRFSGAAVKVVIAVVVLTVLAALAAVGYRERGSLVALYHLFRGPPPSVTREAAKTQPKIEDRVGSAQPDRLPGADRRGTTGPATQPPPAVAQRVVLYEEDPANPAGKRYVGSVIWRTETVSPGPGLAPELAVKAKIEIPERRITMTLSMVRNTDPTLPASHTVDIRFNLPPEFPGGGIANVPGILMKQAEQTRGVPLAGIAVKVTDNVFLIGLSSVDSDVQRNTQLLKERTWFDVPIVYSNGSRAILAMEKGTPGERAFNDAFTAWGRSGTATR